MKNFSTIISHFTKWIKKDREFSWSEEAQKSFELIKDKLVLIPKLTLFKISKTFKVSVMLHDWGIRVVLIQDTSLITYFSAKLVFLNGMNPTLLRYVVSLWFINIFSLWAWKKLTKRVGLACSRTEPKASSFFI